MPNKKLTPSARLDILETRFNTIEKDFEAIQQQLKELRLFTLQLHRATIGLEYTLQYNESINNCPVKV